MSGNLEISSGRTLGKMIFGLVTNNGMRCSSWSAVSAHPVAEWRQFHFNSRPGPGKNENSANLVERVESKKFLNQNQQRAQVNGSTSLWNFQQFRKMTKERCPCLVVVMGVVSRSPFAMFAVNSGASLRPPVRPSGLWSSAAAVALPSLPSLLPHHHSWHS